MKLHRMSGLLMAGLCIGTAHADEKPNLIPARDAEVTYQVASTAKGAPSQIRVEFQAGGQRLRIMPDNQPGYVIVDRAAGRARLVMAQTHLVMELGLGDTLDRYINDPHAQFHRMGPGQVAGQDCTSWSMRAPEATGQGCVTSSGVVLSAGGTDRKGEKASITATAVRFTPLPASDFAPPADYQTLNLSNFSKSFRLPQ